MKAGTAREKLAACRCVEPKRSFTSCRTASNAGKKTLIPVAPEPLGTGGHVPLHSEKVGGHGGAQKELNVANVGNGDKPVNEVLQKQVQQVLLDAGKLCASCNCQLWHTGVRRIFHGGDI